MRLKALALAMTLGATFGVFASPSNNGVTSDSTAPVASSVGDIEVVIRDKGFKIVKTEKVSLHINAHLLEAPNGTKSVVFTDASNSFLFNGTIIDGNLRPINDYYNEKLNPKIPMSANLFKKIKAEKLDKIEGVHFSDSSLPTIYMFSDPLCPFCAKAHEFLKSMGLEGSDMVNVKVLPFAMKQGSNLIWSDVYAADNKLDKLSSAYKDLMNRKAPNPSGVLLPKAVLDFGLVEQLAQAFEVNGTPGFIFFDEKTGQVDVVAGFDQSKLKALIEKAIEE